MLVGLAALAVVAAGCGSEDHPNLPRAPKPIEVTAKVSDKQVLVSPSRFGAGLVVFTISNQSDSEVALTFDGPVETASDSILPGAVANFKVALKEGDYEVNAGVGSDARPARVKVGATRDTAQNELLLP